MSKVKPIEQIVGDIEIGDLVRLKIKKDNNEFVGYCSLIEHHEGGKNPYNPKSNYIEPESYSYDFRVSPKKVKFFDDTDNKSLYVYPKRKKAEINLSGTARGDLQVVSYKILRRAKK